MLLGDHVTSARLNHKREKRFHFSAELGFEVWDRVRVMAMV